MGCPLSKQLEQANVPNPLQQLQAAEAPTHSQQQQQRRRRQEQKRQRQLGKLQERNARKRRLQHGGAGGGSSPRRSSSRSSLTQRLAPQLRLRGGSNGSSATECVSALYARTLELQHEEHQRSIEQKMRHQLERQLHTFLLNQLLLGLQFFGHFEHELAAMDEQLAAKRRACSETLSEHSLLHASAIDAAVAKRLLFKSSDSKAAAEPMQKSLTYVVFEHVDVARPNDANYDSIAALCKVLLETEYDKTTPCRSEYKELLEQCRWMGYVRLRLRDQPSANTSDCAEEHEEEDGGSSGYSTGGGGGEQSDYDYVYITRLNSRQRLDVLQLEEQLERNKLPAACVSRLGSCLPAWLEEEVEEEAETQSEDEEEQQLELECEAGYETVQVLRQCQQEQLQQCYLNSESFMRYFGQLLRQQIAAELGLSAQELSTASFSGCSVYLPQEQLVPAVHVPHGWPDCAFEFNLRARPTLTDLHTGERYQWPTPAMRQRLQSFGYHLLPLGYAPKHARNPFRQLEWRIVFPQAELYLERQLSRQQLKLLLLLKLLLRTFVHDKCPALGEIMQQLRSHLFWHCERYSNDFPDEFLGEQLVRLVRSFAQRLAKKQLPDYFIASRNLLEQVSEDALMQLHCVMSGIAEQPLLHLLQALRRLQAAPDFYPQLDYRRLLDTLLCQDYLQLRSWAKFSRQALPLEQAAAASVTTATEQPQQLEGLLGLRQHQPRTRSRRSAAPAAAAPSAAQRDSLDSFELDLSLLLRRSSSHSSSSSTSSAQLNDGVEILRRTNLLELLLDHQLGMLAKSVEFRNAPLAQFYLEHGQRLCRLYQQLGCSQFAPHYTDALCQAARQLELANSAPGCSPSSQAHRFIPAATSSQAAEEIPVTSTPVPTAPPAPLPSTAPPPTNSTSSGHLDTLLQRLQIDPQTVLSISSKTEQLVQLTLGQKPTRQALNKLLQQKTQQLKSVFN
ncbi:CG15865 [Drosophila busckii]|uniref:CG15865 n=1 Tax=Drosophila busckii TaxID=30019 RepID=A0A0M4ETV4_DROBS|nr:uncharacterized protein LOC108605542 [Drosophila busckii]ALC49076.1 CG15865 [Drosophila busckii]